MISDNRAISIEVRGEGGNVDRPTAESLGFVVVELVINTLKHAFIDVAKGGLIAVTFDAIETEWTLSVSDNGGGKQKHAIVAEGRLGTGIVAALARQRRRPHSLVDCRWCLRRGFAPLPNHLACRHPGEFAAQTASQSQPGATSP